MTKTFTDYKNTDYNPNNESMKDIIKEHASV